MSFRDPAAVAPSSVPTPDLGGPAPNLAEVLVAHRAATGQLLDKHEELVELIEKLTKPARVEAIVLTAVQPVVESGALAEGTYSVGLYNPIGSGGQVNFSVMGSASAADAFPVPAGKLLVLPINAGIIEVGTPVALGAGASLYCFLLRYSTVQPAFYGG